MVEEWVVGWGWEDDDDAERGRREVWICGWIYCCRLCSPNVLDITAAGSKDVHGQVRR